MTKGIFQLKGLLFQADSFITLVKDCIKLGFKMPTHPVEVNLSSSSPVELRVMMPLVVLGGKF